VKVLFSLFHFMLLKDERVYKIRKSVTHNMQYFQIPYLSFLRRYYMVVRKFVQDMEPHIDK